MQCVIAVEGLSAEMIKDDLIKTGLYPDWRFTVVKSLKELMLWSRERPDVLVLSRFFAEESAGKITERLKEMFPATHIVLLIGRVDEKGRAYIKKARENGLNNYVTGRLPGDRPYTLLYALTHTREGDNLDNDDIDDEEQESMDNEQEPDSDWDSETTTEAEDNQTDDELTSDGFNLDEWEKSLQIQPGKKVQEDDQKDDQEDDDEDYFWEPDRKSMQTRTSLETITKPKRLKSADKEFTRDSSRGIFLVTSANKGGVGKTTVAITLAVALARSGVPVVLCDFDFAAPDVAAFFNLKDKKLPGIEYLAGKPVKKHYVENLLVKVEDNLYVLPGPMDQTLPTFEEGQISKLITVLKGMFPVVIGDTPPEFWAKPWLAEVFEKVDQVLSVVDQSKLSEQETRDYAPMLLSMGVTPERIKIVLNRFSPKLHNARLVEKHFNAGFKKDVPSKYLPKVVATIPEDWDAHVQKGYKGEVVGLEDTYSQWHRLAEEIAALAGYKYNMPQHKKAGGLRGLFRR